MVLKSAALTLSHDIARPTALPGQAAPYDIARQPTGFTLSSLLIRLWQKKILFVTFFVITLAPAAAIILHLPPRYSSDALLMVDPRQMHITDIRDVQDSGAATADLNFVRSEMQVLGSSEIARQVILSLHLQDDPEFAPHPTDWDKSISPVLTMLGWSSRHAAPLSDETRLAATIAAYQARLGSYNDARSFIIAVSFSASNPATAQRILAKHIEVYLDGQRAAKQAVIRKAESWFAQELEQLHSKLLASENRQQSFRLDNGLLRTAGETVAGRQLSDVTQQLADARADLERKAARYRQLSTLTGGGAAPAGVDTAVLSSDLIQKLREQEATISETISQLEVKSGANYPGLVAARAARVDIAGKIASEQHRLVVSAQADATIARANVDRLQTSFRDLQQQVETASTAELAATQLARDSDADQKLYADLLTRSKQVAVQREMQEPDTRVVSSALLPSSPAAPRYTVLGVTATTAAILIAAFLTIAIDQLRRHRFRSLADIELEIGLPGLATLPRIRGLRSQNDMAVAPRSLLSASLQTLRNSIVFRSAQSETKVVVFASAVAGDGKTLASALFARSVAAHGGRVLLIDGDLRRAGLTRLLEMAAKPGLPELLQGGRPLVDCITKDVVSGTDVLAAGQNHANPEHLLELSRIRFLLATLRPLYDMIVIDTPPIAAVDDALPFASLADSTVMVVRWGVTPHSVVRSTLQRLDLAGAHVVGAVLNAVEQVPDQANQFETYRLSSSYFAKPG